MNTKQKPAVGYIRMSTDQQQDSPERQRRDIEAMAVQSNFKIIKWYEDHGTKKGDAALCEGLGICHLS